MTTWILFAALSITLTAAGNHLPKTCHGHCQSHCTTCDRKINRKAKSGAKWSVRESPAGASTLEMTPEREKPYRGLWLETGLLPKAVYRRDGPVLLPDPNATPGATTGAKAYQLCSSSFHTAQVRDVSESLKNKVYAEYGAVEKKGVCCEVDHLISLELGGSNDIKNLWPQPYSPPPGALQKDALEDDLHHKVCTGQMKLEDAQACIDHDWYACMRGTHP